MLSGPSPVANVPDGAAVMFSLPSGCGRTPAISQLETCRPMVTSVASSMDTSMNSPAPHQRRRDRKCRGQAADGVGDRIADPQRRGVCVAGHAHDARQPLYDLVIGRIVLERPVLPETRYGAVDKARS